jgi:hypothetical protein
LQVVELARLPIERQVHMFRNAEAIAAPHGAGLAHIAWCRPGTKVIEFFPTPGPGRRLRNASFDYWLISLLRNLDYRGVLAGVAENRRDSFAIPEALLVEALEAATLKPT